MPVYYTYLVSSLPILQFQAKPPLSFDRFISLCEKVLSEQDVATLKSSSLTGDYPFTKPPTLQKWHVFDRALRNELVKIRASRLHVDAHKYIRGDGYVEPFISRMAMNAHRATSILEAERLLDEARWRYLDELSLGHYFDLDFLIIYAHKLLILQRWERIRTANKESLLEATAGKESQ